MKHKTKKCNLQVGASTNLPNKKQNKKRKTTSYKLQIVILANSLSTIEWHQLNACRILPIHVAIC
jgi:hypothetical protein